VNATLRARLERAVVRLEELNGLLAAEEATRDMEQFKKLSREHAEMSGLAALFARYRRAEGDAQAAKDMAGEAAMKGFADEELRNARAEMQRLEAELQKSLLPRDPNDERNIFLEVRAGTGGDESGLFAGDLLRMYTRYAERQGWPVELISESPSELGGSKEVIVRIGAQGGYSRLKFESGAHRVQRVPVSVALGRVRAQGP
jgi:peptide chain release factor 1